MPAAPVTIIVPAYNEETSIVQVIARLKTLRPHDEILVVDDASSDRTAALAAGQGAAVFRHEFNRGYGAALKTGVRRAQGEVVVFFDADGQFDAEDIQPLLDALGRCDMAVGWRSQQSGVWSRNLAKWFLYRLAEYLVGHRIPDLNCGLRCVKKSLVLRFLHLLPDGFSLTTTITLALMQSSYQVVYLPIRICKRQGGKSRVSIRDFFKTALLILRMTNLFSPLKIYVPVSLGLLGLAFPFLVYDLMHRNLGDATLLLFLSSLLIFFFGLSADTLSMLAKKETRSDRAGES